MKQTKRWVALLLAVAMLSLAACGGGGGSEGSGDGQSTVVKKNISVALSGEPNTLDPHFSGQLVGWAILRHQFDTLVVKDENGDFQPSLATEWTQIDETTYQFKLRDDVVFHDGGKLTAEDVVFSLVRTSQNPAGRTLLATLDTENTKAIDEYAVELKLTEPNGALFPTLASNAGSIVSKSAVETLGDDGFARAPVGSGPLKLTDWSTGTSITLSVNEDYWGEKPSFESVQFKFIAEPVNRTIELETGGVDIIYNVANNDFDRIMENENLELQVGPGYKHVYINLSMKDATLANKNLREALAYALDLESLVPAAYGETATPSDSVMGNQLFGYKAAGPNPYDPERAKELLAEAGLTDVHLVLSGANYTDFKDIAEIAKNMWAAVGIDVDIDMMEYAAVESLRSSGQLQMELTSYAANIDICQALEIWRSTYKGSIQNTDPKIDEYLTAGLRETDQDKRAEIYAEAIDYMWDTHYMIPIAFAKVAYATSNKVVGLECEPTTTPDLCKVTVYE